MQKQILRINSILIKHYGIPPRQESLPDPLNILIGTILSQNTNDKNSYKAYLNLKKHFPEWSDVLKSKKSKLKNVIKIAGLTDQKANAILEVLNYLKSGESFDLDYLHDRSNEEVLNELTRFKGVGIKTASCVLLFALGRNVCPVDTHVNRTLKRIGIINSNDPKKTAEFINKILPEGIGHQFHTNLIRLGREYCRSTNPICGQCPLMKICTYPDKIVTDKIQIKTNDFLLLDSIQ